MVEVLFHIRRKVFINLSIQTGFGANIPNLIQKLRIRPVAFKKTDEVGDFSNFGFFIHFSLLVKIF